MVRGMRKDGFCQVYIRVVHNTKPGYIKTDKVVTKQMVDKNGNIKLATNVVLLFNEP